MKSEHLATFRHGHVCLERSINIRLNIIQNKTFDPVLAVILRAEGPQAVHQMHKNNYISKGSHHESMSSTSALQLLSCS